MKKICYLLNHPNDVPWPRLMMESLPDDVCFDLIIVNFFMQDQYDWKGKYGYGKSIFPCINQHDVSDIVKAYEDLSLSKKEKFKIYFCNSYSEFMRTINKEKYDVAISRGREFFIFPEFAKKSIALSMDRCYLIRLLHALPYYNNMTVFLQSERWFDEKYSENFQLNFFGSTVPQSELEKFRSKFEFIDIIGVYKEILDDYGISKIRQDFGFDPADKIALVNFRKAEEDFTTHKTNQEFFDATISCLEEAKNAGYKIVTRERTDKGNAEWDARRGLKNAFEKINHLVDKRLNGHSGFPSEVWRAVYSCDIMLSMDVSGICSKEALVCNKPIVMPYNDYFIEKINRYSVNPVNPIFKSMVREEGIVNKLKDLNPDRQIKILEKIKNDWYNTNISLFWKKVLS